MFLRIFVKQSIGDVTRTLLWDVMGHVTLIKWNTEMLLKIHKMEWNEVIFLQSFEVY